MNLDQFQTGLRAVLIGLGTDLLVDHKIIKGDTLRDCVSLIVMLAPVAWGIYQRRESAKLAKAVVVVNKALVAGDVEHVTESPESVGKITHAV
jgi:hypothetical protein